MNLDVVRADVVALLGHDVTDKESLIAGTVATRREKRESEIE